MIINNNPSESERRSEPRTPDELPLALHGKRLRLWYPKRTITQEELAAMSGAHVKQIRRLEQARRLPRLLASVLGIAHALGVSVEALIAPDVLHQLTTDVDERRAQLDLEFDGAPLPGCRERRA